MTTSILLIDDQLIMFLYLEKCMQPYSVELKHCTSLRQAMELLSTWKPAVILLDIVLVGETGLDFFPLQQADKTLADIPVVMVSSHGELSMIKTALACGAKNYIIKLLDAKKVSRVLGLLGITLELKN